VTERASLLLVEDDPHLTDLLVRLLEDEGYEVTAAPDGQRGLHLGLTRAFDVLVLDRGLPGVEGLDLLSRLRGRGVLTPALVLSARSSVTDRVAGLDAGAEDYLGKPFDVLELLARLRALRRRHSETAQVLALGGRWLNLETRAVTTERVPSAAAAGDVSLSAREAALLATLAARPARVFTREELLQRVFTDAETELVVDTYVHYCRRKLGRGIITTVRGVGYRLGA